MKKLILLLLSISLLAPSFAKKRGSLHSFKHYDGKDYLTIGIGPNYMFGDAGGANFANAWVTEWDVLYTRPSAYIGYQHDWNKTIGNKLLFMYHSFAGNDDNSRNEYRQFEFTSNAFEVSLQTQVYVFRGKFKRKTYDVFVYGGLSGVYYNTEWKYTDITHDPLNPIVYPGRGSSDYWPGKDLYMDPGTKDQFYEEYSVDPNDPNSAFKHDAALLAIPFGAGVRFPITYELYIGAEFGYHFPLGPDADFFDGYYTKWSNLNDAYANLSFTLTYRFAGDDDCYATYGRGQFKFKK